MVLKLLKSVKLLKLLNSLKIVRNLKSLRILNILNRLNILENKDTNISYLKSSLSKISDITSLFDLTKKLYDKGFTGLDLINLITITHKDSLNKYRLLIIIQKVKREIRNEKLLILFILNLLYFRSDEDLENLLGM